MGHLTETRKLSLHPLAIHTFIKAQAGSLAKALSEAVMNSLDAFASSVKVTLTAGGFIIEDDGQGFRTRDEIGAWFETLGFPHDDGNHRLYGKFGMGRAQMWAFAHTVWQSNQFIMTVDVKRKGLDYDLDETSQPVKGTRITAHFYEPLSFQAQASTELELANLIRYVPGLVFINGKVANKDPGAEKWDLETPEAWLRFDKTMHSLDVYNGGVLVTHFAPYRFGCTGVVVTKPESTLALNLARNDILESECKVWPKIVKLFPEKEAKASKQKAAKPSAKTLKEVAAKVVAGELRMEDAMLTTPGLVTSVYGRSLKYWDLTNHWRMQPVAFVPKGDEFGKRLSKLNRAEVVSLDVLELFSGISVAEFKELFRSSIEHSIQRSAEGKAQALERFDTTVWTDNPKEFFKDLAEGKEVYSMAELSDADKATLTAWARSRYPLVNSMRSVANAEQDRALNALGGTALGDNPLDLSWLDNATTEWVLRKKEVVAAMEKPLPAMSKFALARVAELCGLVSASEADGRTLFHRVCTETDAVGTFLLNLMQHYVRECRNRDVPISKTRLSDLDHLNVV